MENERLTHSTRVKLRTINLVIKSQNGRRMLFRKFIVSGLALCWSRPSRIAGIEVPGNKFLSTGMGNLAHKVVIAAVGRSHEGGLDANDAFQSLVDAAHFGCYLRGGEGSKILVRPCVRSNHVSLAIGKLDALYIFFGVDAPI